MLSVVHRDLSVLFVILVIVAFAVAIWRVSLRDFPGALFAAGIGAVIAVLTL